MSPRVVPKTRDRERSYAEFRSRRDQHGEHFASANRSDSFWRYLVAKGPLIETDLGERLATMSDQEHRVLSRATGAGGGFLAPADFDQQITSARRARNVIGELARRIETDHGRAIPLPAATAHGSASWTAENAAVAATDDTFAQVTLNAFKASSKTIVSEELAEDALDDFDEYLGGELGQRLALLEESAFAVGDGVGKPQGITTAGNGIPTVVAAAGSATGFKLAEVRAAWASLPPAYEPSASWIMSPSAFASLANLTDTAGGLVLPSLHAAEPSLYGARVFQSPELPAAAANARSVAVGDLSVGYAVRRVRGLGIKRQQEIHSDSGQIGYLAFERVDGRVVLPDALRVLAHSAT